ncbi:MAG: HTH domain-containing protein [Christensenellales bacterium]
MTANERRNAILEVLCMRRFDTLENLAFEFGVSKRTIRYDIEILSLTYPIYTVQGNGGGIHVDDQYRLGKNYLKEEQQELLERLLPGLKGKDVEVMKSIIKSFGLKGAAK